MVNLNNYCAYKLGEFIKEEVIYSTQNKPLSEIKKEKRGIWISRRYYKSNKKISSRLYIEFYLFKRWFQFGWLKFGRFEIDLFKNR
ncbi:MAG: hypothetical protein QXY18_07075 [Nitrososphaerota archaeon]